MERLICIAIGYVLGLIQTGYIYGKLNHIDIRNHGSGNAGTTNALRTLGWKAGAITLLGDSMKCVAAVLISYFVFKDKDHNQLLALYGGLGAVLGHNYPFYLKFKGGKGIASTLGLILAIHPIMFLVVGCAFLVIVFTTQYVSLGSIVMMILFVVQVVIYGQLGGFDLTAGQRYEYYVVVLFLALMAIFRHRANIKRLLAGKENKTNLLKMGKKS